MRLIARESNDDVLGGERGGGGIFFAVQSKKRKKKKRHQAREMRVRVSRLSQPAIPLQLCLTPLFRGCIPTGPFTISEPQDQEIGEFYVLQKRTSSKVVKGLRVGRVGEEL